MLLIAWSILLISSPIDHTKMNTIYILSGLGILSLAGAMFDLKKTMPMVLLIGLVLAIPFCVVTAQPRFSKWLAHHRIAAIPEELLAARRASP